MYKEEECGQKTESERTLSSKKIIHYRRRKVSHKM